MVAAVYGEDDVPTAHLIAAAPAMYGALKGRIARHDGLVRANGGSECEDEFCNLFRPIVTLAEAQS